MEQLALGIALGFGAGVAPGPLMGLVITGTLRRGFRTGARIAFVPMLSDLPLVLLCLTVVAALPHSVLTWLTLAGGLLLIGLGAQTTFEARTAELSAPPAPDAGVRAGDGRLLRQAIAVNYLNPHPWLFWIGIGGPLLVSAWRLAPVRGAAFLLGFYALIVGTKVVLAALVGLSRGRLSATGYRRVLVGAGVLLALAGVALIVEFVAKLG